MGSYLSATMLVFRLSVLPRTCETPCGEGPDGPHSLAPRVLLSLPLPAPLHASHHDGRYFLFCRIFVVLVLPSLPLYPDTSLVTFHIQSPLAYLKVRYSVVGERGGERIVRIQKRMWEFYSNNFFTAIIFKNLKSDNKIGSVNVFYQT